ncbi:NADH-quinone oxidoreductase subunit N [Kouleothrix aurantiaca]|uniref:NADH-quinone oxidoreductase subunit N n=1 Tax=Kouleothrix aurantiaca TaxID=186479 RepID=A0A0P9D817_9CHLR|nr:NADH-quinone oxidoreductase subunit N [Kouleothrix aurantiaca]
MNYLQFSDGPWLTFLVLSPLVGMLLVALSGALRMDDRIVKIGATAWSLTSLGLAIFLWAGFNPSLVADGQGVIQFVEKIPWIDAIKVDYFLGVDGISLPLVLLTTVMTPIAMLASFNVEARVKMHFALLFLLEAAMLGYFVALNFFFFFIFWEFSLVPAFFIIQNWGRNPEGRSRYAAFKFFVYTMGGSVGMLLLFQFFYVATRAAGIATFDLVTLGRLGQGLPVEGVSGSLQDIVYRYVESVGITNYLGNFPLVYTSIAFWAIFIAFAIKLAVWPFHTWLPDAYSEAPTAGSILLSAVMSKMGAYGMLRIMLPLVPDAAQFFGPVIGALALIGIVAGAFGALSYTGGDIKRLIGYTSINHMGYVALAIAAAATLNSAADAQSRPIAINGAVMQMVAHGLSTGALFLLVGYLYQRTGTYNLRDWGGLRKVMPMFSGVMGVAMFANLGLPGLAGFVGEFFIFRGTWASLPFFTLLATIGLVVSALALLQMYARIFNGPLNPRWDAGHGGQGLPDMRVASREFLAAAPLLVLLLVLGVYPAPIMDLANQTATALVNVFTRVLS